MLGARGRPGRWLFRNQSRRGQALGGRWSPGCSSISRVPSWGANAASSFCVAERSATASAAEESRSSPPPAAPKPAPRSSRSAESVVVNRESRLDVGHVDGLDDGARLGEVARRQVLTGAVGAQDQLRLLLRAELLGLPAAGVETASGRRVRGRRHVAHQHDLLALAAQRRVGHRHGRQQRLGVRVRRAGVDLVLRPQLGHPAEVHDADPVRDVPHDGQVVGDEDVRQAELVLQLLHQVDDLGLHRDVERRDRLVADEHLRVQRDAAGDADALPLATRELVGVAVDVLGVEPDEVEQLLDPLAAPTLRHDVLVDLERLSDDVADRHPGVERGVGVLEDDLDVATQPAHLAPGRAAPVGTLEDDLARGGLLEAHEQPAQRGLATAGLADDAERLALVQVEAHAVDGLDLADRAAQHTLLDRVVLDQFLCAENDLRH